MYKILAVDNDRFMLEFLKDVLSKEGYVVRTAEDGLVALDILKSYTPDIIFVDLIMPKIDGKKLCKIIRGMDSLKNSHLIILSATVAEEKAKIAELDVDGCIAKGPLNEMAEGILAFLRDLDLESPRRPADQPIGTWKIYSRGITKELLSLKGHFELILEKMAEGILEITSEGRIVYANQAALSLLEMPEGAVLASHFGDLFAQEDRRRIEALLNSLTESPESIDDVGSLALKDHEVTMKVLPIGGDEPTAIVILDDITGRKRMERELKTANEQLKQANKRLGLAYAQMRDSKDRLSLQMYGEEMGFLLDADGQILGATEKAVEDTGRTRATLLGRNILDFVESGDRKRLKQDIWKSWSGMFTQTRIHLSVEGSGIQPVEAKLMDINMQEGRMLLMLMRQSDGTQAPQEA